MTDNPSTPARSGAFSRRAAIKGLAATAGLAAIPGALAACSSSSTHGFQPDWFGFLVGRRQHQLRLELLRPGA